MTDEDRGKLLSHQAAIFALLAMPQNRALAKSLVETVLESDLLSEMNKEFKEGFSKLFIDLKRRLEKND